jgi:hypothetical protein
MNARSLRFAYQPRSLPRLPRQALATCFPQRDSAACAVHLAAPMALAYSAAGVTRAEDRGTQGCGGGRAFVSPQDSSLPLASRAAAAAMLVAAEFAARQAP